jgi:hypothetical protein
MRILVLDPIIVVVIAGSEATTSPFKLHDMVSGKSPRLTLQVNWTNSPSLTASRPKEKGEIIGISEKNIFWG